MKTLPRMSAPLVVIALTCTCSSKIPHSAPDNAAPGPTAPQTATGARTTFQPQARAILEKLAPKLRRPSGEELLSGIADLKTLAARRQPFSQAFERVDDTLTESERSLIGIA